MIDLWDRKITRSSSSTDGMSVLKAYLCIGGDSSYLHWAILARSGIGVASKKPFDSFSWLVVKPCFAHSTISGKCSFASRRHGQYNFSALPKGECIECSTVEKCQSRSICDQLEPVLHLHTLITLISNFALLIRERLLRKS